MSEVDTSVLRRKLKTGQPAPVLSAMTPKKAMRLAVARGADRALGCVVALSELDEAKGSPEELTAALPDPALLLRLEGPDLARGLAVLCPQAVAAMIEAQTMGRVLAGKAPDRPPTRTDAMLVTEFVDLVLAGFSSLMAEGALGPPISGFACAGPEANLRAACMALRDADHVHYTVGLDFAGGVKIGALHVLVPAEAEMGAQAPVADDWGRKLNNAVLGSATRLEAVLCRQKMPLSRVTSLAVGDVLRLDTASLDRVALSGPGGSTLLTARLGRSGASRALRLDL